jgi:hypothetical protein
MAADIGAVVLHGTPSIATAAVIGDKNGRLMKAGKLGHLEWSTS